jgi:hypothetical protein
MGESLVIELGSCEYLVSRKERLHPRTSENFSCAASGEKNFKPDFYLIKKIVSKNESDERKGTRNFLK